MRYTEHYLLNDRAYRNYLDRLIAFWPDLKWRHAGLGMLQAYIREGETHEQRAHLWHPSLIKPGIQESGLCHDHRFMMRSTVLVGAIHQTEFVLHEDPDGDWETWRVLHAREALKQGGSHHQDPVATGDTYRRLGQTIAISAGQGYQFQKFQFHESRAVGLTITLVDKYEQEEVNARILAPRGNPIVHAFTETQTPDQFANVLAEGLAALQAARESA